MLIKLIKHDLISLFKRISLSWLVFAAIILISIPVGLSIDSIYDSKLIAFVFTAPAISILGFVTSGLFSSFGWFSQKMFSNEGYLTHSLPARTSTVVLSKVITTLLLSFVGFVLALFSSYVISVSVYKPLFKELNSGFPFEFSILISALKRIFTGLGMKIAISQFLGVLSFILMGYFSISLAQFFHSSKRGLMAVIYFIVIGIAFSMLGSLLLGPIFGGTTYFEGVSFGEINRQIDASFTYSYVSYSLRIVLMWAGTMWICSKYLNLKG